MTILEIGFDPTVPPPVPGQGGGGLLLEGTYHLRATAIEVQPPKAPGGNTAVKVKWDVIGSETGLGQGKNSSNRFTMSKDAVPKFLKPYLDAAGVRYDVISHPINGPTLRFDPDDIIGSVVQARTYHGKANPTTGKQYNEWTDYQVSSMAPNAPGRVAVAQPMQPQPMTQMAGSLPPPGAVAPGYVPQQQMAPQGYAQPQPQQQYQQPGYVPPAQYPQQQPQYAPQPGQQQYAQPGQLPPGVPWTPPQGR